MIAFSSESLIVLAIGCLVLDFVAFRHARAIAGHGRLQMLQMAAIWVTIISGLTILISMYQP